MHRTAPRSHIIMPTMRGIAWPSGVILGHQNEPEFIFLKRDILGAIFNTKHNSERCLFLSKLMVYANFPFSPVGQKITSLQPALVAIVPEKLFYRVEHLRKRLSGSQNP